jgi:hypothetical protein
LFMARMKGITIKLPEATLEHLRPTDGVRN